ncbi:hypothetical protein BBP40_001717 [Aspergillus hancockii]|nr:hypothetical protein BBP40_001717 [Aspergillus hancockii]
MFLPGCTKQPQLERLLSISQGETPWQKSVSMSRAVCAAVASALAFEGLDNSLQSKEDIVLNNCIKITEPIGGIGFIGQYMPSSAATAGAPLLIGNKGVFPVQVGLYWMISISINGGVVELQRLQPILQRVIESGRAKPSFVIDEVLHSLDEVSIAYESFARREIGKPVIQLPYHPDNKLANGS